MNIPQARGLGGAGAATRPAHFTRVYEEHSTEIFRLAYLLTGDRMAAEDLTQDTFVRVMGRWRDLRRPESLPWYLRRTLVNLANSRLRRVRIERQHAATSAEAPRTHPAGNEVDMREDLRAVLGAMPPRQRAALVLRYYEDLSEREIAEVLNCSVAGAKSLIARARKTIRGLLPKEYE